MPDSDHGVDSLTNFKRQTTQYLERLHTSGEPIVLTVKGQARVVVQDVAGYQRMAELAARVEHDETVAAIREGLADVEAGRTRPARPALRKLARKYGLTVPGK